MTTTVPHKATLKDLHDAMLGEAFAYLKYRLYSDAARSRGNVKLADLFEKIANVEWHDHFSGHAKLAGLSGSDADNLRDAIGGEDHETTSMYPDMASRAEAAGDKAVAAHFSEVGRDEAGHRDAFRKALKELGDQ